MQGAAAWEWHAPDPEMHGAPRRGRGGVVDGIVYRNIVAKDVATALSLTLAYTHGLPPTNATATPRLRNVLFQNATFENATSAGEFVGLPESPIVNVTLRDVRYVGHGAPPPFGKCEYVSGRCEGGHHCVSALL